MTELADVFKLNRNGLNVRRAVEVAVLMLLPLIVLHVLDQEVYYLSVAFGALFTGLNDPGGEYAYRLPRLALNAVAGALLTALGFAIGDGAWGVVVLAAFVITFAAGLMLKYGLHGFTAAYNLNCWFLVAIALPVGYHLSHGHTNALAQGLAWLIGSALTIAVTAIMWLARGRTARPQPVADLIPGDAKPVPLTRPVILFALIRAIAVAIAVAIAFGLHLPNADWMPIAAIIAMKGSLNQSTLFAMQRLAGAIIGAVVAALFLLTVDSKIVLEVVLVVLGTLAGSIRGVNYAFYCAAMAGMVLIADDLPHPHRPRQRGTPGTVHLRRRRDRRRRHAPGRPAAEAHRRQSRAKSGSAGTCSQGPAGVSGPGSRRPGARHTAAAMAYITITSVGVGARTADGRAAGCDAASRASSLALTPSVHVAGAT
jgi:hypothetical protein